MMFGYATNETENYMPLALDISHKLLIELARVRKEEKVMTYLRPDAKAQVTLEYSDEGKPQRIDSIVISTQHDDFAEDNAMLDRIREDMISIIVPSVRQQLSKEIQDLFNDEITYHVNPTGKFVIGGPHGDAGLTGRKIIVDTYGGKGAHGGGAFSGKDPSKVDRSAAYATRHIAKNLVAAGVCDEVLVQVSYAIGVAHPTNIYVQSYGTSNVEMKDNEIADKILELFDLRPYFIETSLGLRNPIYSESAAYGHMGRKSEIKNVSFTSITGEVKEMEVKTFPWEELNRVDDIKKAFNIN
jgi:S-adenosylmethionine synthetase